MDPIVEGIVIRVATQVRAEIEKWASSLGADIWEITPEDLGGCCGIASHMLHNVLKELGIKSTFVMGHFDFEGDHTYTRTNHCWLAIGDSIIDITATQFMLEKILITSGEDERYYALKTGAKGIKTLLDSWRGQSPTYYKDDMRKIQHKLHTNLQVVT